MTLIEEFNAMLARVVVPPASDVQPENELKPDPARLAFELKRCVQRLDAIENFLEGSGYDKSG